MRIIKTMLALLICFSLVLCSSAGASAKTVTELQKELKEKQSTISSIKAKLKSLAGDKAKFAEEKSIIEQELQEAEENIAQIRSLIQANESSLAQANKDYEATVSVLSSHEGVFSNRIRYVYEQGRISYLEVIFGAKSFSDFLSRLNIMQDIMQYDKDVIEGYTKAKEELLRNKKAIEDLKLDQESLLSLESSEKNRLEKASTQKEEIIEKIETNEDYYKSQLAAADKEMEKTSRAIENALASARKSNPSSKYAGGTMAWPVAAGGKVTSVYGYRTSPAVGYHYGVDIAIASGNDIVAANDGVVVISGWNAGGYGNYVVVDHGGGISTLYAHASKLYTSKGQSVKRGQAIAAIGSTGFSTGPHLHFEVMVGGKKVDPYPYIK